MLYREWESDDGGSLKWQLIRTKSRVSDFKKNCIVALLEAISEQYKLCRKFERASIGVNQGKTLRIDAYIVMAARLVIGQRNVAEED